MTPFEWILAIGAIVSSIVGIVGTAITNKSNETSVSNTNATNKEMQDSANATNLQIAQDANAAQASENEKAYQRSKAGNQVNLMMQAGMSRAGAINALNGGGSYTPAPINTAQVSSSTAQAFQRDPNSMSNIMSGLIGSLSNVGQMKETSRQFNEQQELREREITLQETSASANIEYTKAQTLGQQIKNATDAYNFTMQRIKENPEQYSAIGKLSALDVNPADYDTSFAYLKALREKAPADVRDYLSDATVIQALEQKHQVALLNKQTVANTGLTNANTGLANANTSLTNAKTKLTNEQINLCKESVKLTSQQVQTELEKTNLTKEQAKTCAKQYEQIAMQVDEYMRPDVVMNRYQAEQMRADMLQFAHDIQMDERDLKHLELQYQQVEADISGNYAGQGLRMWSYVVQHMLPIKGLLGGSK